MSLVFIPFGCPGHAGCCSFPVCIKEILISDLNSFKAVKGSRGNIFNGDQNALMTEEDARHSYQ